MLRKLVTSPDADRNCYEGVSKFHNRLGKLSKTQVISALHKFGSQQYFKKINPAAKTALKRAQKWSIGVQPTSTQRRKDGNGSKKRLLSGGNWGSKISNLPATHGKRKRKHVLSENVVKNVLSAKKHAANMKSKSRPTFKKTKNSK